MHMASRVHYLLGLLLLFLAIPSEILALRPYVTTDADVVDSGVLEIELGVAFVRNDLLDETERRIEIPWVLNMGLPSVGLFRKSELIVEGVAEFIDETGGGPFDPTVKQLAEVGLLLKKVWWKGTGCKPSFGVETGMLIPTGGEGQGVDWELVHILSWELDTISIHSTLGGGLVQAPATEVVVPPPPALGETDTDFRTRPALLWGLICEYTIWRDIRMGVEYSLGKVETVPLEHLLTVGLLWESPWRILFDLAGRIGLNEQSEDFGITFGLTYAFGEDTQAE
jgi:hypothetical protein